MSDGAWKYPAGVRRVPLPAEAQLAEAHSPSQKPQKRAGTPRRAPKFPTASTDAFVGGVTVVVPFDALCPDNQKYGARAIRTPQGTTRAGLFLSAKYRACKGRIEGRARAAMAGNVMAMAPVALRFRVWMPDKRQRDMMNYAKLLCDALSGICYDDDSLIHFAEWHRVGLDRAAPRIEVTVYRNPVE